jgi:alginate O-acetyltransferase complex protein AlgI
MVFSSLSFLCIFLPVFLLIYLTSPKKYRNFVLLGFSIIFYAWGAPKFIFVVLLTTALDYYLVNLMSESINKYRRRFLLIFSLIINVGLLAYFKYSNFFIENINSVFSTIGMQPIQWLRIILPIGISFYTFETITYVVDVYNNKHKPLRSFLDYQLYIMLFPKLIAGPIIRYHDLSNQIPVFPRETNHNYNNVLYGLFRFSIGLAKKVLIANQIGIYADEIFDSSQLGELNTLDIWLGVLAYTLQLYYDFSGYSDMAIGLAKTMGFDFKENFNNPYNANSITDFWRRWHISLGAWMKNYLYIPLGGNRVNKYRNYLNLWIVFFISGLWHGASWNFVLWGVFHGFFILIEKAFLLDKVYKYLPNIVQVIITFFIVMNGWVLFRSDTFGEALEIYKNMYQFNHEVYIQIPYKSFFFIAIGLLFSFIFLIPFVLQIQNNIYKVSHKNMTVIVRSIAMLLLITISAALISSNNFNPFIYFRF